MDGTPRVQRFCSSRCQYQHRIESNPKRRACAVCHKPVLRKDVDSGVCSANCGYARRKARTRPQAKCKGCSAMFWPRRQGNGAFDKTCSRRCYLTVSKVDKVSAPCRQCGTTFESYPKQGRAFCSVECARVHFVGEQSPHYRGTRDPNRGSMWARLARQIRERDGHACRRCGKAWTMGERTFHVDHLIPWRWFEDKTRANDQGNLFTLCHSCHGHKTGYIERRFLRGDVLSLEQFAASLSMPSAVLAVTL